MTHLSKDIPYRNTKIAYGVSKNDIDEMLKEAGALALHWVETPESFQGKTMPVLEFVLESKLKGIETRFIVRIQPPLLSNRKRMYGKRGGSLIEAPDRNASMRLLYWYLKARLEAVRFGLEDVFDAFMSRVLHSLPDGQVVTMGETIKEHPEELSSILPSFEIKSNVKALPSSETVPLKVIRDGEYQE